MKPRLLSSVWTTIALLMIGLGGAATAAERCATLASAPNGLTVQYPSGESQVITDLGDRRSRIDSFAADGSSLGVDFTIAGAFNIESVAPDGEASVAIERWPAADVMLPFAEGGRQTFELDYRRSDQPNLRATIEISVVEMATVFLPAAKCDLDVALLRYDVPGGPGSSATFQVNAPDLGAPIVMGAPARLSDVSSEGWPIAVLKNDGPKADRVEGVMTRLLAKMPAWLPDIATCPTELASSVETPLDDYPMRCVAYPEKCLDSCRGGHGSDCFSAALAFQAQRNTALSEALFLRACALGITSGCVNRAAALPESEARCAFETFDAACSRDDAWGCTMAGSFYHRGLVAARSKPKALTLYDRACSLAPDSDPCAVARQLSKKLKGDADHDE